MIASAIEQLQCGGRMIHVDLGQNGTVKASSKQKTQALHQQGINTPDGSPSHKDYDHMLQHFSFMEYWEMSTDTAALKMKEDNISIDYLHIDAGHSHSQSLLDFENYLPLMNPSVSPCSSSSSLPKPYSLTVHSNPPSPPHTRHPLPFPTLAVLLD